MKPIRSITPGPGNYEQKPKFGYEGKTVSLRGKPIRDDSTDAPGPGAYDPREPKPSAKSIKIMNPSKSAVEYKVKEVVPGPGQYTPEKHFVSNSKNIPKWTLGDKVLGSSFHGVLEKIHGSIPAPGNYDLDRSLGDGPKVNFYFLFFSLMFDLRFTFFKNLFCFIFKISFIFLNFENIYLLNFSIRCCLRKI